VGSIIIYGTQYGTSKKYADKLSEMTDIKATCFSKVKNASTYSRIIYIGSLYAGGVKGLRQTVKGVSVNAEIIIITVGLADPHDPENIANIREAVHKQIPEDLFKRTTFFHLRGAIDYKRLNIKHRIMMSMLYKRVKKKPDDLLTSEDRMMIATYNQIVDFVDYNSLEPIVDFIRQTDS